MNVEFKQLSDAIGAEILNVDISMPLEPDVFDQIRKIWLDHNIILFRGQPLEVEQQVTFSRLFGAIELHSLSEYHMKGYPEIFINSNVVVDGKPIGAQKSGHTWHSDSQFLEVPSAATILHAREAPTEGGDTLYANMYRAYESLPAPKRQQIVGLRGVYSRVKSWSIDYAHRLPLTAEQKAALSPATHPIVRTHPETGRKALYIGSQSELVEIVGLPVDEGSALAAELFDCAIQDCHVYAHRWQVGDTVVWDNRCTMHRAMPFDEAKYRRLMHRTTIQGTRPYLSVDP